jgi:RNA ligase
MPDPYMRIDDLFSPALLAASLATGHVRQQLHPTEPLAILNYTEICQYTNVWDEVTFACRGLIFNTQTRQIVARPFPKFFNHGQTGAPDIPLNAAVEVTDKADGSMGILYELPSGGHAIATRGSFTSDQALHATEVWDTRYIDQVTPLPGTTALFEIIYPANRIVVDYRDVDDLVLLGGVQIADGINLSPQIMRAAIGWTGPLIAVMPYATLAEALAAEPRPNSEGLVVTWPGGGWSRVKVKQEDYVRLHRIVTGLTARVIWEHLAQGLHLLELIAGLPDEFHAWARAVADSLESEVQDHHERITKEYAGIIDEMRYAETLERRDFADRVADHPDKWALFFLLDQRDIRPGLWQMVRPAAGWTPSGRTYSDAVA